MLGVTPCGVDIRRKTVKVTYKSERQSLHVIDLLCIVCDFQILAFQKNADGLIASVRVK